MIIYILYIYVYTVIYIYIYIYIYNFFKHVVISIEKPCVEEIPYWMYQCACTNITFVSFSALNRLLCASVLSCCITVYA